MSQAETPPAQPFADGPHQRLRAYDRITCAQRLEDHRIDCDDGLSYDFGPLRDFAVLHDLDLPLTVPPVSQVCALTVDGAVLCDGPRDDPSLTVTLTADPLLEP